ncbi:MAG: magnesium chelatase subunit D, partial [Steroidobacteraceae bacterium]
MNDRGQATAAWADAGLAAALCAVDPQLLGGVMVRAGPGPVRDEWLARFRGLLDQSAPVRRMPVNVPDDRLLGGLDLVATLRAGRPVAQRGLLCEVDGGLLVVPGAERLGATTAARLAQASEQREVAIERDGIALRSPASFLLALLDESLEDDERPAAALLERIAFIVDLEQVAARDLADEAHGRDAIVAARRRLAEVAVPEGIVEA